MCEDSHNLAEGWHGLESTYREGRELSSDRGSSLSGGVVVGLGISGQQSRRDGTSNSVDLHYDDTSSARMILRKCDSGVDRQIRLDAFATSARPEGLGVKERQARTSSTPRGK